jgi:hypothetical protein
MKNKILIFLLSLCSFSAYSLDMYDAMVCEASPDNAARLQCYRSAGFSIECQNKDAAKELACYREIGRELERKGQELLAKKQTEMKKVPTSTFHLEAVMETPIPRSAPGDRGGYFLLNSEKKGNIIKALHKRVGLDSIVFTLTETNCVTMNMRELGVSSVSPSKIQYSPTKWFELVPGSSKSDLAAFLCEDFE